MNRYLIVPIVLCALMCKAQLVFEEIQKKFPTDIFDKANTTEKIKFLSEKEKQVVILCNIARLDGKWFAENILEEWLKENNYPEKRFELAVNSLKMELMRTANKPPFEVDKTLTNIAKEHATNMGKSGKIGHDGFEKRYKEIEMKPKGENCQYGLENPVEIVVELLVDHLTVGYGHRVNLLGLAPTTAKFNKIGVGIAKHKKYEINTVMSFSGN